MSKNMWMIRAGRGCELLERFLERGEVAIGWSRVGDLSGRETREAVISAVEDSYAEYKRGKVSLTAGQLFRFAHEIDISDFVITYDSSTRQYHLGEVCSNYQYEPVGDDEPAHVRKVEWKRKVSRDQLSVSARNSLGSIATLFLVPDYVSGEITREESENTDTLAVKETEEEELREDVQARSREFIKDAISKMDWEEVQDLVAGLLRAMGYKTRVSPKGSDRGKDIVASPDGFGFEQPRIVVEVKHRQGSMGSQEIRSFLGGRHNDDKGLYVSTGGFSKDARYEAERAAIPLTLMSIDDLVDGIGEHYENVDSETRTVLPLTKVYWPA